MEKKERKSFLAKEKYALNPEKYKAKRLEYHHKNRDKSLAAMAEYRLNNRSKINAWHKRNRELNPEKLSARKRLYRINNQEKTKASIKNWRLANKERYRITMRSVCHRRRVRIYTNSTPDQIRSADLKISELLSVEKSNCFYCGVEMPTAKLHVDHVYPIFRGGFHSSENLTLACKSCNSSKGFKILGLEWVPPKMLATG